MDESLIHQVADSIQRYLQAHPEAGDTAVGVHLWWVGSSCGSVSKGVTLAALESLQAAGYICCRYGIWSGKGRLEVD